MPALGARDVHHQTPRRVAASMSSTPRLPARPTQPRRHQRIGDLTRADQQAAVASQGRPERSPPVVHPELLVLQEGFEALGVDGIETMTPGWPG